MKKTFKTVLVLTFLVTLLVTFSACGLGGSKLVGKWTKIEGYSFDYFEFFSDGTYTSSHPNYEGKYSVDGNRLKLSGILVESKIYTFKIKGDTLSLYYDGDSDSPVLVLKKK